MRHAESWNFDASPTVKKPQHQITAMNRLSGCSVPPLRVLRLLLLHLHLHLLHHAPPLLLHMFFTMFFAMFFFCASSSGLWFKS